MTVENRIGLDWSDKEDRLIVSEYFKMLSMELSGKPFNKAEINRRVQAGTGRGRGSVEFKNQNISAVLQELGIPYIVGYKPLPKYQGALLLEIDDYLKKHDPATLMKPSATPQFAETRSIFFERPPELLDGPDKRPDNLVRLVRKYNPAERDERNRALGRIGEERVYQHEINRLRKSGNSELAKKVIWVSEEQGDGAGYDILSFSETGKERLIEVKTTIGNQKTPFFISRNEVELSGERPDAFHLVRLYDFARAPKGFVLTPPLENFVALRAENYKASFS